MTKKSAVGVKLENRTGKLRFALSNYGQPFSHSAVHSYVRVRALCKQQMYALPDQVSYYCAADEKSEMEQLTQPRNMPTHSEEATKQGAKKYVFQPEISNQVSLANEDLSFNDPLNLNLT